MFYASSVQAEQKVPGKLYSNSVYEYEVLPDGKSICIRSVIPKKKPVKPLKVLDLGCGEEKDAVFLARNGYIVTAFDLSETGIENRKREKTCRKM